MWMLFLITFYGSGNMKVIHIVAQSEAQCRQFDRELRELLRNTVSEPRSHCFKISGPSGGGD